LQEPFLQRIHPLLPLPAVGLLLMGGDMMSKKKEQEQDGELDGGVRTQDQETEEDEQILELSSCF
jgi:hypothetical protein